MRRPKSSTLAGIFALAGSISYVVVWYVYLFTASPSRVSVGRAAIEQLKFSFSAESPARWVFVLLAALPVLGLCLGCAYLAGFASSRRRGFVMLGAATLAGLGAILISDWSTLFTFAASIYYGWRHLDGD